MYFIYVDESGDDGIGVGKRGQKSPVDYYILTGVVVPVVSWNEVFRRVKDYRRSVRNRFGIKLQEELHASDIVGGRGIYFRRGLPLNKRLNLYEDALSFFSQITIIKVINVLIKKNEVEAKISKGDLPRGFTVKSYAWRLLIQRFHNFLEKDESDITRRFGLIIADEDNRKTVVDELRRVRVYNPVPSRFGGFRNIIISTIVEDPSFRKSDFSYFVQFADLIAYALAKRDFANRKQKTMGLHKLFRLLEPILLKEASIKDEMGIVYYP